MIQPPTDVSRQPYPRREKNTLTALNTNIHVSPDTLLSAQDQLVDMKFITRLIGLTDKWFYKLIQDDLFPKPIKLGRSSRWLRSKVEAWLQLRITE